MTREEARAFVNAQDIVPILGLERSVKAGANMYCCPVCGSGKGKDQTGALKIAKNRGKCYSGKDCFTDKGEDFVGMCRTVWGCSEDEVFTRVIGADWKGRSYSFKAKPKKTEAEKEAERLAQKKALDGWMEHTKSYVIKAAAAITESPAAQAYLTEKRGITAESIARFSIGYDASKDMIVLPYNMALTYYEGRYINPNTSKTHGFPKHEYNGIELAIKKPIFNVGALNTKGDRPVFVVESIICAVSIMQEAPGTMAIAIGGTSGVDALVDEIKTRKAENLIYILCLDNDDAGEDAQKKLKNKLTEAGAKYIEYNIAGAYKDPNEALINDREGLKGRIAEALELANEKKQEEKKAYLQANSNREYLLSFIKKTKENTKQPWTATGIKDLDSILDQGLYPGLIIVGAVSSLGKTTLAMQIMDNIAAAGRDALIFSLEMDREELISKSISRHTFFKAVNTPGKWEDNIRMAKTCRGISDGSKYANYSKKEHDLIADSIADYGRYAHRLFIFEGVGNIGVFEIRQQVEEHIRITGEKPVVLVDYMQILAPYKDPENPSRSFTDKQIMDKNVLELKRISRDYALPVIAVSSLNRASYNETMSMAAFKESGAIEYSADILLGLEYANIKTEKDLESAIEKNAEKNAAGDPTEIRVRILKNRSGARGATCLLDYYPMFNAFLGHGEEPEDIPEAEQQAFTDVTEDIDVPF